ncbi:MAG: ABC transporter permease, partial [Hymenobacter sp.]
MAAAAPLANVTPGGLDSAVVVPPAPARSPGYYVRQRLWANRPAVAGLGFIIGCALVALLGYWILPDPSPDANNGFVQLQKQPPGFTAKFIRRTETDSARAGNNLFKTWWQGQPAIGEIPINSGFATSKADSLIVEPWSASGSRPLAPVRLALKDWLGSYQSSPQGTRWAQRTYWLGTDKAGRDELSRLLLGTRISLGIGLVAVLISLALGVLVGALAGYFGGWLDSVLLGLMTVVW